MKRTDFGCNYRDSYHQRSQTEILKGLRSGLEWFRKFNHLYPYSNSVDALLPEFRAKAKAFIEALKNAGAQVKINTTYRHPDRAWLMRYAWLLAKGEIQPHQIPKNANVNIIWDHGDILKSKQAAQEMISPQAFNIVYTPVFNSKHGERLAIDMDISWNGVLKILKKIEGTDNEYEEIEIKSDPKNGANADLAEVGKSYGVYKLAGDRPHWSNDGH